MHIKSEPCCFSRRAGLSSLRSTGMCCLGEINTKTQRLLFLWPEALSGTPNALCNAKPQQRVKKPTRTLRISIAAADGMSKTLNSGNSLTINASKWRREQLLQSSTRQSTTTGQRVAPTRRATIAQMQPARVDEPRCFEYRDSKGCNGLRKQQLKRVITLDTKPQQKYYSNTAALNRGNIFRDSSLHFKTEESEFCAQCQRPLQQRFLFIDTNLQKTYSDSCPSFACSSVTSTPSGLPPISPRNPSVTEKNDQVKRWLTGRPMFSQNAQTLWKCTTNCKCVAQLNITIQYSIRISR